MLHPGIQLYSILTCGHCKLAVAARANRAIRFYFLSCRKHFNGSLTYAGTDALHMPSLFAGKIHAVLCRAWRSRIKGRDLYDYIFYLSKGAPVNRMHLRQRLIDSGYITDDVDCTLTEIKKMLCDRFDSIDFEQAKRNVEPFIRDTSVLDIWSADFFTQITMNLTEC